MTRALFWAGAALQIVLFQLLLWSLQSGKSVAALGLGATAAVVALGIITLKMR